MLADALALADEEAPELLIDMATLTGAARVALGPELPPFFTDDDALAADLMRHAEAENDPLWRMPLWRPYEALLDSKIADINNVSSGGLAGSITARCFSSASSRPQAPGCISTSSPGRHRPSPGRPEGGECQAARAIYALLTERYG